MLCPWDKTAYVLGVEGNKDKENPWVVSEKTFTAFQELHLSLLEDTKDEGLRALYLFLQQWQPQDFDSPPCSLEMIDANVVFRLDGARNYLHQSIEAQQLWQKQLQPQDHTKRAYCLVRGEKLPVARLHPSIKGVYGGQSSGSSIVSFKQKAFTSYGKEQGDNAPVSETAVFAYTTALNYLLRRENGHCLSIGDASTVFWAQTDDDKQGQAAEQFFSAMTNSADEAGELQKLSASLEKMTKGRPLQEIAPGLDPNTRFYVLGLAPNAARLSIRYWLDTTFGILAQNLARHWQDLYLEPVPWRKPPSMWRLLIETTPKHKDAEGRLKKSDTKSIPPQLAGEFMRSILTGTPYPQSMLTRMIERIRSDGYITPLRVSIVKAVLQRNYIYQKEVPMGLNREEIDTSYRLGRLFAVLEIAQSSALGNINANIRDRYYGGASATPNSIFPLCKGKKADWVKKPAQTAGWLEKQVAQIMDTFPSNSPFPNNLSLEDQGRFVVGYYHWKIKVVLWLDIIIKNLPSTRKLLKILRVL